MAVRQRRSHSKVTDDAPDPQELAELVSALVSVADHSSLRPWRFIELRGDDRDALGHGLAEADGDSPDAHEKYVKKARRAPLVLAIVVSPKPSKKVPVWEQEAVASGAAHTLSLLLDEAGWGVIWRTGLLARTDAVRRAHRLAPEEYLLGWLYVGGIPDRDRKAKPRKPLPVASVLSPLHR
ncbi:MAG: nitroreductase family protein [Leucobacter sp.]